jgi:hypothetical protein
MMQINWIKQIGVAGAFTLAAVIGASGSARAQDDSTEGNSIWNLEQRVWGGIVRGLGLKDPNSPTIDYRERSPLVVPPSRDLPPPQARAIPRDPSWPADPDAARTKAREKRKVTVGNAPSTVEPQGRPIAPDELNRGVPRQATPSQSTGSNAPAPGTDPDGGAIAPSELGYFGGLFSGRAWGFGSGFGGYKDETGTFTSEPQRSQLTAPPPGYQTPSAAQPYGVTRRIERAPVQAHDPAGRDVGGAR